MVLACECPAREVRVSRAQAATQQVRTTRMPQRRAWPSDHVSQTALARDLARFLSGWP